jgi:hypothetical protein
MEMLSGYCSPRRAWWLVCKAKGTIQGFLEFNVRIYTTGVINPPLIIEGFFISSHSHTVYIHNGLNNSDDSCCITICTTVQTCVLYTWYTVIYST